MMCKKFGEKGTEVKRLTGSRKECDKEIKNSCRMREDGRIETELLHQQDCINFCIMLVTAFFACVNVEWWTRNKARLSTCGPPAAPINCLLHGDSWSMYPITHVGVRWSSSGKLYLNGIFNE
jgi:hypothetical protein